jgi:hypothetical protein
MTHAPGKLLVVSTVLVAAGGLVGLTGFALGMAALVSAARRRVGQMDVPPTELARVQLAKARAATAAGMHAWRRQPVVAATPDLRPDPAGV